MSKSLPGLSNHARIISAEKISSELQGWMPLSIESQTDGIASSEKLTLRAAFVGKSGRRAVIGLRADDGRIVKYGRVAVGDKFEGWQITQIEGRKVTLSRDGNIVELRMFRPATS